MARQQVGMRTSALLVGGVLFGWNLAVLVHHHAVPTRYSPATAAGAPGTLPRERLALPPVRARAGGGGRERREVPGGAAESGCSAHGTRCRELLELQGTVGFDADEWARCECAQRLLLQRTAGPWPVRRAPCSAWQGRDARPARRSTPARWRPRGQGGMRHPFEIHCALTLGALRAAAARSEARARIVRESELDTERKSRPICSSRPLHNSTTCFDPDNGHSYKCVPTPWGAAELSRLTRPGVDGRGGVCLNGTRGRGACPQGSLLCRLDVAALASGAEDVVAPSVAPPGVGDSAQVSISLAANLRGLVAQACAPSRRAISFPLAGHL